MKKLLLKLSPAALLLPLPIASGVVGAFADGSNSNSVKDLFTLSSASVKDEHKKVSEAMENSPEYGVEFSSSSGMVTYKNIVDLHEVNKTDNLVEIVANSSTDYNNLETTLLELSKIHIRVADAYDSSIYFDVNLEQNPTINQVSRSDFEGGYNNLFYNVTFNGYTVANNSDYSPLEGYTVAWRQSLFNAPHYIKKPEEAVTYLPTGFKYDIETNQVLVDMGNAASGSTVDPHNQLVFDLDDPTDSYPDFAGFTTGEVVISVYTDEVGSFMINKIGNDTFVSAEDSLFQRNTGNLLTHQFDFENMIDGAINHYYPLPSVLSNSSYELSITKDGKAVTIDDAANFIPKEVGEYGLKISSANAFGYLMSYSGTFTVNESPTVLNDVSGIASINAKMFESFTIPTFSYEGGNGSLTKTIQVLLDDEVNNVNEGDSFVIEKKVKNASIRVTVSDEIKVDNTFTYPINLDTNVTHFYLEDAFDINYVSYGQDFEVPSYVAIDYSKEDVSKTNMEVDIKRGKATYYQAGDVIPNVKSDFELQYISGGVILKTIRVIATTSNISSSDTSFDGFYKSNENVTSSLISASGMKFTLGDGDTIINEPLNVSTTDLNVSFCYFPDLGDYQDVDIAFSAIGGKQVVVSFKELGEKPLIYLNGKRIYKSVTVSQSTYTDEDSSYLYGKKYFKYSFILMGDKAKITNASSQLVTAIDTFEDGSAFTGFKSAAAQIQFKVNGAKEGNVFVLNQISNQQLTTQVLNYGDTRAPYIGFEAPLSNGIYKLGEVVSIPKAYAHDVLNSTATVLMSVMNPDGEYIIRNAEPFAFDLPLTSYGVYYVSFSCTDGNNQTTNYGYRLVVSDDVAPEIYTNASYAESYSGKVYIYKAKAYDNIDGELSVLAILRSPDGDSRVVTMGQEAELTMKGEYVLTYYAMDQEGNVGTKVYTFINK